jgi:hypothetical protein
MAKPGLAGAVAGRDAACPNAIVKKKTANNPPDAQVTSLAPRDMTIKIAQVQVASQVYRRAGLPSASYMACEEGLRLVSEDVCTDAMRGREAFKAGDPCRLSWR